MICGLQISTVSCLKQLSLVGLSVREHTVHYRDFFYFCLIIFINSRDSMVWILGINRIVPIPTSTGIPEAAQDPYTSST